MKTNCIRFRFTFASTYPILIVYDLHYQGVHLAKLFEQLVSTDDRFEVPVERHMGMVVFRLKGENEMTEKLLKKLNGSGNVFE